jgi:hypothetical protein
MTTIKQSLRNGLTGAAFLAASTVAQMPAQNNVFEVKWPTTKLSVDSLQALPNFKSAFDVQTNKHIDDISSEFNYFDSLGWNVYDFVENNMPGFKFDPTLVDPKAVEIYIDKAVKAYAADLVKLVGSDSVNANKIATEITKQMLPGLKFNKVEYSAKNRSIYVDGQRLSIGSNAKNVINATNDVISIPDSSDLFKLSSSNVQSDMSKINGYDLPFLRSRIIPLLKPVMFSVYAQKVYEDLAKDSTVNNPEYIERALGMSSNDENVSYFSPNGTNAVTEYNKTRIDFRNWIKNIARKNNLLKDTKGPVFQNVNAMQDGDNSAITINGQVYDIGDTVSGINFATSTANLYDVSGKLLCSRDLVPKSEVPFDFGSSNDVASKVRILMPSIPVGKHNLVLTAVDNDSNVTTDSNEVTVSDYLSPVIGSKDSNVVSAKGNKISVKGFAVDMPYNHAKTLGSGIKEMYVGIEKIAGGSKENDDYITVNGKKTALREAQRIDLTVSNAMDTNLINTEIKAPAGKYAVTVFVTDSAGNIAKKTYDVETKNGANLLYSDKSGLELGVLGGAANGNKPIAGVSLGYNAGPISIGTNASFQRNKIKNENLDSLPTFDIAHTHLDSNNNVIVDKYTMVPVTEETKNYLLSINANLRFYNLELEGGLNINNVDEKTIADRASGKDTLKIHPDSKMSSQGKAFVLLPVVKTKSGLELILAPGAVYSDETASWAAKANLYVPVGNASLGLYGEFNQTIDANKDKKVVGGLLYRFGKNNDN